MQAHNQPLNTEYQLRAITSKSGYSHNMVEAEGEKNQQTTNYLGAEAAKKALTLSSSH